MSSSEEDDSSCTWNLGRKKGPNILLQIYIQLVGYPIYPKRKISKKKV
jgi:hypothetical protein